MTWPVVARWDVDVLREDRSFLLFPLFFALLAAAIGYAFTRGSGGPPLSTGLALLCLFAVPLTAATVTHEAVPAAVASGRVRLALSLPHTRSGFLSGTGAARLAVTLAGVAAAVVTGGAVFAVRGGALAPLETAAVVALAVLLAAAFVAGTLALTAGSASTTLAAAAAYAFFAVAFFWPVVVNAAAVLARTTLDVAVGGAAIDAAIAASPIYAYGTALAGVGVDVASVAAVPAWTGVLVLSAWTALGYAAAVARFDRLEL
ncbi:MAG: ABC transporter permease subunit [Halobacterium sp.]